MTTSQAVINTKRPLWVALSVLSALIVFETISILILNDGVFLFTLDDPYIHLALAENIANGHYGVNNSEYSAPSSSILWPFFLAPFAQYASSSYVLLLLNSFFAGCTIWFLWKTILPKYAERDELSVNAVAVVLVVFIFLTNLVGLIFTGMEHSAQALMAMFIVYGMSVNIEEERTSWLLISAIIIAPLVRYECLALSVSAIFFLWLRGGRIQPIMAIGAILVLVVGFSVFLMALGLESMPMSVIAKSSVVSSTSKLSSIWSNFRDNLSSDSGITLCICSIFLVRVLSSNTRVNGEKALALSVLCSILLHLLFGNYGWYHRYEIYILVFSYSALFYLYRKTIYSLPEKYGFYWFASVSTLLAAAFCTKYLEVIATIPLASNNIFEQQYQMHRFTAEYYNKPVAVNDLGLVVYGNREYVLDLWGLASMDALRHRQSVDDVDSSWLASIVERKNVDLAIIYDHWFPAKPGSWHKVGELALSGEAITPAGSVVSFYATNAESCADIAQLLAKFSTDKPEKVQLDLLPQSCE